MIHHPKWWRVHKIPKVKDSEGFQEVQEAQPERAWKCHCSASIPKTWFYAKPGGKHWEKIQFSLVTHSCPTLCDPMNRSMPGLPVHHQLPEFTQTHVHWVGDAIQPSHPPPVLIFPSIRVFSNESALHIRWPKYWSFSLNISPSNEYSGLISLRMDWLDLLAVQGTLKSLLQHHSSKASVLWHSAFFTVQLSHPYKTTGKIRALTRWTSVGKVLSLLFNILSAAAAKSLQSCLTLYDPIDDSPPGSPSLGFSRQEHWSGLPFPSLMH